LSPTKGGFTAKADYSFSFDLERLPSLHHLLRDKIFSTIFGFVSGTVHPGHFFASQL